MLYSLLFPGWNSISEKNHITQKVFSCRKHCGISILYFENINSHFSAGLFCFFYPPSENSMAWEYGLVKIWNSLIQLFSVVFIVGLQQPQRRTVTLLQFALWQQPAGLSCAIPTCVPGCSTHEANKVFPKE